MHTLAFPRILLILALPPLAMRHYAEKILKEEIPDEEKLYKAAKIMVACIFAEVVGYLLPTLFLGIADAVSKFVGDRIGNVYLGALVFTAN
ncbi:hypothetical protein [Thermococcus stetteri]|uniref:hypothetical protein n=1 Tax=Thermococcus stetteri TaxID=49900 RepID=UPI001AE110EA|nr:hypothetical protein [Thermococcus stetteri]